MIRIATITTFDKPTCKRISDEAVAALQAIAEAHGPTLQPAGGTIGSTDFTLRVRFTLTQTASGQSPDQALFEKDAHYYGLKPTDFGAEVVVNRTPYRIAGLIVTAGGYPIKVVRLHDQKEFRMVPDAICKALGRDRWTGEPLAK